MHVNENERKFWTSLHVSAYFLKQAYFKQVLDTAIYEVFVREMKGPQVELLRGIARVFPTSQAPSAEASKMIEDFYRESKD